MWLFEKDGGMCLHNLSGKPFKAATFHAFQKALVLYELATAFRANPPKAVFADIQLT